VKHDGRLTIKAHRQLKRAAKWRAENRSALQAERWMAGFLQALCGLADNPERHPLARENGELPITLRELRYGLGRRPTHRAVFVIRPNGVIGHTASAKIALGGERDASHFDRSCSSFGRFILLVRILGDLRTERTDATGYLACGLWWRGGNLPHHCRMAADTAKASLMGASTLSEKLRFIASAVQNADDRHPWLLGT
jgi:hypothetical protein